MQTEIKFTAYYGDETKQVELSYLTGGYYHIYIDKYYVAQIHKRQGEWVVLPQHPDEMDLTTDDIQILIDKIIEHEVSRS